MMRERMSRPIWSVPSQKVPPADFALSAQRHPDALCAAGHGLLRNKSQGAALKAAAEGIREVRRFKGHSSQVYSVSFAPDGRLLDKVAACGAARKFENRKYDYRYQENSVLHHICPKRASSDRVG